MKIIDNKIDFIICSNDEQVVNECKYYLDRLKVAENFYKSITVVKDAYSMTEGYNRAMKASDAKYKVYLHQDVFIVESDFIEKVIDFFKQSPSVGMVGVLGTDKKDRTASYWKNWDLGCTYVCDVLGARLFGNNNEKDELSKAEMLDGMLLATQYDITWREEFNGFDFYDISQCEEFRKHGYEIGVIKQENAWCMHDCGHTKFKDYDKYRKIFCELYKDSGYVYEAEQKLINRIRLDELLEKDLIDCEKSIDQGDFICAMKTLNYWINQYIYNTELCLDWVLMEIMKYDIENDIRISFFLVCETLEEMKSVYRWIKYYFMRVEFTGKGKWDEYKVLENKFAVNGLTDEIIVAEHSMLEIENYKMI